MKEDTIYSDYTTGNKREISLNYKDKTIKTSYLYLDNSYCSDHKDHFIKVVNQVKIKKGIQYDIYEIKSRTEGLGNIVNAEQIVIHDSSTLIVYYEKNGYVVNFCANGRYLTLVFKNFTQQEFEHVLNNIEFL